MMTTAIATLISREQRTAWWQWGKLLGAGLLVGLLVVLASGVEVHSLVVALVLHIALDFSLQSNEVAMHKGERKAHLLIHAIIVGGLPALMTGSLLAMAIGIITHYAIDYTRKFNLPEAQGAIADQVAHTLVLAILAIV